MGTIIDQETAGEPLLLTGTTNVTDMTFRQLRQMQRLLPGLPAAGGVQGLTDCAVTNGAAGAVVAAAGYVWVAGTTVTGLEGQQLYGVPVVGARTLTGIPSPTGATRRDIVVVRVYDEGDAPGNGGINESRVQYIVNATESLAAEATPANSFKLADVDITTAGAKTITDRRWTLPTSGGQVIGGYKEAVADVAAGDVLSMSVIGDGITPMNIRVGAMTQNTTATFPVANIFEVWDGAGGTGVRYAESRIPITTGLSAYPLAHPIQDAIIPAFSGPKTVYLRLTASAGTPSVAALANRKAFIRATWAPGYLNA